MILPCLALNWSHMVRGVLLLVDRDWGRTIRQEVRLRLEREAGVVPTFYFVHILEPQTALWTSLGLPIPPPSEQNDLNQ